MSTGMRKWMEKDCPEIECLSAQVLIDREELKQLRADLEKHKAERDALRVKIAEMEKQEPVKYEKRIKLRSKHTWGAWWECDKGDYVKAKAAGGHYPKFSDDLLDYEMRPLYALPGAKPKPDCGEAGHDEGRCGNRQCIPGAQPAPSIPEFCPCCGNIMRACMCCPNEDCNAVTVTAEQAKYNKQHAVARKASGAAEPTPEAKL